MPKALIVIVVIAAILAVLLRLLRGSGPRLSQEESRRHAERMRELVFCNGPLSTLAGIWISGLGYQQAAEAIAQKDYDRAAGLLEMTNGSIDTRQFHRHEIAIAIAKALASDVSGATDAALKIASDRNAESRMRLAAWSILREVGYAPPEQGSDQVLGVVVEWHMLDFAVLLAGFDDSNACMLLSTGGGTIGNMTEFPRVTQASLALLTEAQRMLAAMPIETSRPLPGKGRIRFYALTPAGMHVTEDSERDARRRNHYLFPLYSCKENLLTSMRKGPGLSMQYAVHANSDRP